MKSKKLIQKLTFIAASIILTSACSDEKEQQGQPPAVAPPSNSNVKQPNSPLPTTSPMGQNPTVPSTLPTTPTTNQVASSCNYNINGVQKTGTTAEQCAALDAEFRLADQANASSGGNYSQSVACTYNINGREIKGSSQAECDALQQKYGF